MLAPLILAFFLLNY